MADVHLLGNVGRREVDDDLLLRRILVQHWRPHAVLHERHDLLDHEVLLEEDVDEAGPGDLQLVDDLVAVHRHLGHDLVRHVPRRHLDALALEEAGDRHRPIELVVAELGRDRDRAWRVGYIGKGFADGLLELVLERVQDAQHVLGRVELHPRFLGLLGSTLFVLFCVGCGSL